MNDQPGTAPKADEGVGYQVPPQIVTPPDAGGSPYQAGAGAYRSGPPLAPPEDSATPWGPAPAPAEPDRWNPAVPALGGTALLDRPTVARRPAVAPPVRPLPPGPPDPNWDWGRSHGLRNALIAAGAIVLVGLLIAAYVVFRSGDDGKSNISDSPATTQPVDVIEPTPVPTPDVPPAVDPVPPATVVPVAPPTTAAVPAAAAPPATSPPTTAAPAPPTTSTPTAPTVVLNPPYTCGPVPSTAPITTKPCSP